METSVAEMVSTGLDTLIADATGILTTNAPAIIGVIGVFAGVNLGIKLFRSLSRKVG